MNTITNEPIDALAAAIRSLLPEVADPAVRPGLMVNPLWVVPTGLGGFVGMSADPQGQILGRRLEATVEVIAKALNAEALSEAVTTVTRALLSADRATLLELGLLNVTLDEVGPKVALGAPGSITERALTFRVLFEFLKQPEEAERTTSTFLSRHSCLRQRRWQSLGVCWKQQKTMARI
jgi:hypothetical protein